jgi:hypothetical protein
MNRIALNLKDSHALEAMQLGDLKIILDSGLASIEGFEGLEMPRERVGVYLFLRKNLEIRRKGLINDEHVVGFIDELVTNGSVWGSQEEEGHIETVMPLLED